MPVAEIAVFPDEISLDLTQQCRHMAPGRYRLNIGVAHEYIRSGRAKAAPEDADSYSRFDASCRVNEKRQESIQSAIQEKDEAKTLKVKKMDERRAYNKRKTAKPKVS